MRERISNLKYRIQKKLGVVTRVWIGTLLVVLVGLAVASCPVVQAEESAKAPSWCEQWNTYGDVPGQPKVTSNERFMFHLGFFLTKSDKLREMIKNNNPTFEDKTLDKIMVCYEENTPTLVEALDKVCSEADPDQDKKVDNILNMYINWCISQNTTKT